jgi:putative acyl-CoA dehydrogenase
VCKRAPVVVGEALECLGGNGYVEDSGMPRLYREAPVNSIWEGAGNVNALDVVRVLHRNADALAAFRAELDRAAGVDDRLDRAAGQLGDFVAAAGEATARRVAERLALLLSASLLARYAPSYVAETFCASRLGSDWGYAFGTLPAGSDTARIVARATPLLD